jgi:hypothetical protein
MSGNYITVQLRRPRDDDPGLVDEAWFVVKDGLVTLTTRDGNSLHGEFVCSKPKPNETEREAAARLLRSRSRMRAARPFNRPLRYPAVRY